jgi:hypothetical protein
MYIALYPIRPLLYLRTVCTPDTRLWHYVAPTLGIAASPLMPPFLPESEEQFTKHVSANPQVWYYYYQAAYLYIKKYGNTLEESTEQSTRL